MAYTLSFALLGAILLTLTLVPALLSYALRRHDLAERHSAWMERLQRRYRTLLNWAALRRKPIVAASLALLALALVLAPRLGSEFLPKLDEGNVWLTITLPPSTAMERTKDVEREVRRMLQELPGSEQRHHAGGPT